MAGNIQVSGFNPILSGSNITPERGQNSTFLMYKAQKYTVPL